MDPAAYFWYHGLTKIDFTDGTREIWDAGPAAYCSAPSFAPRAAASEPSGSPSPERSHELAHEDDGWLLAWVTHADHTELVILDARAVAAGPVVRLRLDAPLPPVSHAMFHPGAPLA